jgi:thiosulfate dehydrogenase [quinone] large subunit
MRTAEGNIYIAEPRSTRWLFASSNASPLWLVARLWLGYEWLSAGWDKVFGEDRAAWMETSTALRGFTDAAIEASQEPGHPQVAYSWWVDFLGFVQHNSTWISKVLAVGEVLIGVALLLGIFTGIAAAAGLVLNFSFVFSGSAGVNPAFMIVGLLLVLAWRNAGFLGVDRGLLRYLGTPWQKGELLQRAPGSSPAAKAA